MEVPLAPRVEKTPEIILDVDSLYSKEEEGYPENSPISKINDVSDVALSIEKDEIDLGSSSSNQIRAASPEKPRLDSKGIPIAYVLQVASMADRDRAEKVHDSLLELGHKAYLRQVKLGEAVMYRVYVGPKFEKLRLATVKPEIDKIFKVDSVILRYVP